jgi:hypothetical protein
MAADALFHVFIRVSKEAIPHGYRLPFALTHLDTEGVAILSPHDREDCAAPVVTTVLDPGMSS